LIHFYKRKEKRIKMPRLIFVPLFLIASSLIVSGNYVRTQTELTKKLLTNYNKNIKPDHKVTVNVNMYVRAFTDVDDIKGTMDIQVTFRQKWQDSRLQYTDDGRTKFVTLIGEEQSIWVPDTFVRNELEARVHKELVNNEYLRVFPDGTVLQSTRISMKTLCPMAFHAYPFDSQTCELQFASYGWTNDDIEYVWKEEDPLQIVRSLFLPKFRLEAFATDRCDVKTATGEYSCLKAELKLKRESSPIVMSLMVPLCMVVIVSYLAFFIPPSNITARVLIGLVCLLFTSGLLAVFNLFFSPKIAYTRSIDIYNGVCVLFIFLSVLETVLVAAFYKEEDEKARRSVLDTVKSGPLSARLDLISRVVFAVLWVLFVVLFMASSALM